MFSEHKQQQDSRHISRSGLQSRSKSLDLLMKVEQSNVESGSMSATLPDGFR